MLVGWLVNVETLVRRLHMPAANCRHDNNSKAEMWME